MIYLSSLFDLSFFSLWFISLLSFFFISHLLSNFSLSFFFLSLSPSFLLSLYSHLYFPQFSSMLIPDKLFLFLFYIIEIEEKKVYVKWPGVDFVHGSGDLCVLETSQHFSFYQECDFFLHISFSPDTSRQLHTRQNELSIQLYKSVRFSRRQYFIGQVTNLYVLF